MDLSRPETKDKVIQIRITESQDLRLETHVARLRALGVKTDRSTLMRAGLDLLLERLDAGLTGGQG